MDKPPPTCIACGAETTSSSAFYCTDCQPVYPGKPNPIAPLSW